MLDILRGTPLWVYAVFFVVTYYGVLACFENRETKRSLQLTPLIFVTVSLFSLNLSQGVFTPLASYGASLAIGWLIAFYFYSYRDVGREGNSLVIGGTPKVLIVYWVFSPGGTIAVITQRLVQRQPMTSRSLPVPLLRQVL